MLDGTLATQGPLTSPLRPGRFWLLAVVCSAVFLAACASRTTRAPVSDQSTVTSGAAQASGQTYVVRAGDTLYKIAQDHGMTVARLEQLNNISNPSQLSIGQVLRLEGSAPAPSATAGSSTTKPSTAPVKTEPTTSAPTETATTTPPARASDASLVSWGWPASGKIIQGFNSTTKGIDIEGPIGSPVVAAASGKVLYAGNGVRGLGNLILLGHGDSQGHDNGFITAYAHNQTLLVKTGQSVTKGQKIATLGQTDTSSPRLHFEIRRRGTPVNPLAYLPSR